MENVEQFWVKTITYNGIEINFKLVQESFCCRCIERYGTFYEADMLEKLRQEYKGELNLCLDVGAHIGNHTIFFQKVMGFKMVHSFEPQDDMFHLLVDNIWLNKCQYNVVSHNFGLCDVPEGKYGISNYVENSKGRTSFSVSDSGGFHFKRIDDLGFSDRVDLIKIDVEGMEINVMNGALETIKRDKPFIWFEEWDEDGVHEKYKSFLDLGYGLTQCGKQNFFLVPQ